MDAALKEKIEKPWTSFNLDPHHYRDLKKSGLTDDTIRECGFYTEGSYGKLATIIGWKNYPTRMGSALVIPFRSVDGELDGYKRIKPSTPKKNRNGQPQKYVSPKGRPQRPYFPPGVIEKLSDASIPLIVTEGEKKAVAATQEGFPCIGLVGVFSFSKKGEAKLCPELLQVKWSGREVYICYDSDLNENENVADAESRLAAVLKQHGAKVKVIRLPDGPNREKQGLDDFLVNHGKVEFVKLYDKAEEPNEVDAGEVKEEFEAAAVAQDFLTEHCLHKKAYKLRFWRDEFWVWVNQRYMPIPDSDLRCDIRKYIDSKFVKVNVGMVTNTLDALKSLVHVPHFRKQPTWLEGGSSSNGWISFANGIGNVHIMSTGTNKLKPCTPMFFSPVVLPFNFDPEADCPKWFDFLSFNLECDSKRIELLQEWFGYCLLPGTKFQKFLMLYGEGGTGKSTALAVLRALLGDSNVSSVPLEQFDSRFSLIQTLGKLANIISDTAEIDKAAEGHLKSFTSGDKMQFEQKGKPVFSEIPSAKLVLATNNLPRFTDRSAGIWRRISLIPFDVKVEESRKVRGMDSPQWWLESGEMSGVFNWALQGLIRLEERGTFTSSEKCEEIIEDYRIQSNPAMAFLNEEYSESANGFSATKHMYKNYSDWCEENGYRRLGSGQFGKEVVRAFPSAIPARRSVDDVRQTGYDGICRASIYDDSFEVSGVSG